MNRSGVGTRVFTATAFAGLSIVGYLLMVRGINLSDEGFLLQEALDMLDGKVLYRDIEMFIAPGIWFLVAGLFAIVEPSVIASRAIAAVSYFALAGVIFHIVRVHAGLAYGAACVAAYAVLAVWSFPHWTWAWYSPYSILFALLAMQAVLAFREHGRTAALVVMGLCIGATTIFKQNYGFFALVACVLGIAAIRFERGEPLRSAVPALFFDGLRIAAGLLAAVLPMLLYFGYHGALYSIYDRFVLYPLEFTTAANIPYLELSALWSHDVFADRVASTNYLAQLALNSPANIALLPAPFWIHFLHAVLYWLPPVVLFAGFVLAFMPGSAELSTERRVDGVLFVSTTTSALLFLGIFPRADYTHLVTVYQPLLITGALVWHRVARRLPHRTPPWAWAPLAAGVGLTGLYSLAALAWLSYLVSSMTAELPQRRGGVLVQEITSIGINQLVEVVRANTGEGEPFFGLPDMAMINFLAERPVPGSQYQTYAHMIARDEGARTTEQLDAANVRFAIARYDNVLSTEPQLARYAPVLAAYLDRHFDRTWMIQNDQYILLERRATPRVGVRVRESVLGDCAFAGGNARESSVRGHLFFESLFQPLSPDSTEQSAETHCRVRVPEDARFAVDIGYKRPIGVERGATLTARVFAIPDDGPRETLIAETLRVQRMNVDGTRPPETHRVDLAHLAGRDVTLVFRTERRGRVRLSPFTIETYGMFWQDPVLEIGVGDETEDR